MTEHTFKERWYQHKHTFKYEHKANSTELSKYVWNLQRNNIIPILSWKIIDYANPYINGKKSCNLCLTKIPHFNFETQALNKRSELVSTCCHVNKYLLKNHKAIPPDAI